MLNSEAYGNWIQKMRVDEDEIDEYLSQLPKSAFVDEVEDVMSV